MRQYNLGHIITVSAFDLHCNYFGEIKKNIVFVCRTCERFQNLVCDRKLWDDFDFSEIEQSAEQIIKKFRYLNKNTKEIKLRGLVSKRPLNKWKNYTITENMLTRIKVTCPKLEKLVIYEAFINSKKVTTLNPPDFE